MKLNRMEVGLGGGTLLQIANRSSVQMMSYLIETPTGKTVVIDGGNACEEDGLHLAELIAKRGGRVDFWFMTHAHVDHFGALLWLLENRPQQLPQIGALFFTFPPEEWLLTVENGLEYEPLCRFNRALQKNNIHSTPLHKGDCIDCSGITVEALNDPENYSHYPSINDTTICLLVHFPNQPVLFLGDLAVAGEQDLLQHCDKSKLRCDMVQMAHHGQCGVDRAFYEIVRPKICLYTAPDWLWENDNGGGRNSGPWQTLVTRQWMKELGAQTDCPHAYGDYLFV